jgi:holo-[acyl-carrier protein] synthase
LLIIGTGIDIAAIARFERFVNEDNQPLFRRLFTQLELDYCFAKRFAAQPLALRFAAKEAFLKALGTGLRDGISWLEIEIRNDELGKPHLSVSGRAAVQLATAGADKSHLSLSDDGGFAIAMVILEGR